jgi:hypothetical protein
LVDNWNFKNEELIDNNFEMQKLFESYNSSTLTQKTENMKYCSKRTRSISRKTPKKPKRKGSDYTETQNLNIPQISDFSVSEYNYSELRNKSVYSNKKIQRHFKKNQNIESIAMLFLY